jgi:hypothetical protein
VRRRWFSRRALGLHAVIIVIIPTFAALCDWQVHRALGGNQLSWAYVFEWPFFGGYAVYMWWRFVHEEAAEPGALPASPSAGARAGGAHHIDAAHTDGAHDGDNSARTDDAQQEDAQLAAYNAYLAELAARDKPKQWH